MLPSYFNIVDHSKEGLFPNIDLRFEGHKVMSSLTLLELDCQPVMVGET